MEEVYGSLKTSVLGVTESVVGTKVIKKGKRKRGALWTEELRKFAKEEKGAYMKNKKKQNSCKGKK